MLRFIQSPRTHLRGFPVTIRRAESWSHGMLVGSVHDALLLAVALDPRKLTGGGEERTRRSWAKSAIAAAAACGEQGVGGRSRELPVGLYSRGS